MYTIKEVSEMIGVSKVTLRYYDKIGLLKSKRLENQYRTYDELDIHILRNIVVFKQAGFSLEDIKILVGLYWLEEGDNCNDLAKEVITRNLKVMHLQISFLQNVMATIEGILPLFQTHELYKINQKELDEKMMKLFEEAKGSQEEKKDDKD